MKRRLAAILSADVVGYSSLMGADETGTFDVLRSLRSDLIDPLAARWHGRTFKLMGDGALMEFASAVDAVQFAVAVQSEMAGRSPALATGEPVRFRIGINSGEVIDEGGDLYGDCVNVAARLEAEARPGGITVSDVVKEAAGRGLDLTFVPIGQVELKNIAEPVAAWSVALDEKAAALAAVPPPTAPRRPARRWIAAAAAVALLLPFGAWMGGVFEPSTAQGPAAVIEDRPSIAVLPFENPGGGEDYFADGIAEDLITDLSKIPGLFVIARNSSFSLKGQFADVREISELLDARYIVEGSVRRAGETIRITVQLTDAPAGRTIWSERYDRPLDDLFAVQDEVRERIASKLAVKVDPTLATRLARRQKISVEAYDLLLKGIAAEGDFTRATAEEARALFNRVTRLEPDFAEAYARLSSSYDLEAILGWTENRDAALEVSLRYAEKAVSLNPVLPYSHWTLGRVHAHGNRLAEARAALHRAIELSPNYADAYAFLALVECYYGNATDALGHVETAIALNPLPPFWYWYARGLTLYLLDRPEDAVRDLARSVDGNPNVSWARQILIAAHADLGNLDDAEWEIEELAVSGYDVTLVASLARSSIQDQAYRDKLAESLRTAGIE